MTLDLRYVTSQASL